MNNSNGKESDIVVHVFSGQVDCGEESPSNFLSTRPRGSCFTEILEAFFAWLTSDDRLLLFVPFSYSIPFVVSLAIRISLFDLHLCFHS